MNNKLHSSIKLNGALPHRILRDAIYMQGSIAKSSRYNNLLEEFRIPPMDDPNWWAVMDEVVSILGDKYRDVIIMRCNGMTLALVGEALGISGQYVKSIEAKALKMLRHPARSEVIGKACGYHHDENGKWYG